MDGMIKLKFDWVEYSVFTTMMLVSALIGVYFGFIKKAGQDTVDGYLLGGKNMSVFPISMSLISSFISGISLLGIPAEIYTFGLNHATTILSYWVVAVLCAYVFLPVFFKLQAISVYEYMELRFNKVVRKMVSFLFTVSLIAYITIVIYGPGLALNQVSDLGIYTVSFLLCAVCIFYTTFGGLKAVVWTDTIQAVAMYGAVFAVGIIGTIKSGGFSAVIANGSEGGRLELAWDVDPRLRISVWSSLVGFSTLHTASSAIHPSFVQRFISLKTIQQARLSVLIFIIGCTIFAIFNIYMGLVVYSTYKDCDPLSTGIIKRPDQILPYYIVDVLRNFRGLPGVFVAGIVCAALSTMSAGLNTLSGTIYEDFIEPITGKSSDATAAKIMKSLVVGFGLGCLLLSMVIEKLGSLIELSNSFSSPTAGTVLGIFILGLFFPHVNSTGATVGGLVSLTSMAWIILGSRMAMSAGDIAHVPLPMSVDNCPYNFSMPSNSTLVKTPVFGKTFPLYEISIFYYSTVACILAVVVGIIVSYFTGPNKLEKVNRDLLSPLIYRFLPEYSFVPDKEVEMSNVKHS